ncbi:hypothetical protein Tco_0804022 [Tanacetum coccineum]|uniref:Uncharacterized protein n=1 Tax=Tanacetum coccineum TaxID=301880 RepID=A0ABQ5A388_9ASTR
MIKLRDLGANTPTGVPYTEEQILARVIKGKQRGHIPGRGRQVVGRGKTPILESHPRGSDSGAEGRGRSGRGANNHEGGDEDVDGDDDEGY